MQESVSHRPRPRQDPVSCDSCRKKKLKCDRGVPCANCTSRGVACEYQGRRPVTTATSSISAESEDVNALRRENAAIKARIDRLEELIYSGSTSFETDDRHSKARRVAGGKSVQTLVSPSTGTLTGSPHSEAARASYSRDVQWLEGVGKWHIPISLPTAHSVHLSYTWLSHHCCSSLTTMNAVALSSQMVMAETLVLQPPTWASAAQSSDFQTL